MMASAISNYSPTDFSLCGRVLPLVVQIDPKRAVPRTGFRTKKIFVGGLLTTTTEEAIREYFSQFGQVDDLLLPRDRVTTRPRGFGFVTFESEDTVETLCSKAWHEIDGKTVCFCVPKVLEVSMQLLLIQVNDVLSLNTGGSKESRT